MIALNKYFHPKPLQLLFYFIQAYTRKCMRWSVFIIHRHMVQLIIVPANWIFIPYYASIISSVFFWATLHWCFNYITENYIKKYLYARALIIHFVRSSIKTNSLLYMSIMIEMMMIYPISLSCNMLFLPICKFVWGPAFLYFLSRS